MLRTLPPTQAIPALQSSVWPYVAGTPVLVFFFCILLLLMMMMLTDFEYQKLGFSFYLRFILFMMYEYLHSTDIMSR